jgi:GGDEF domain-containing protein
MEVRPTERLRRAGFSPDENAQVEEFLSRADSATYRAKQQGGNQICVDEQEPGQRQVSSG